MKKSEVWPNLYRTKRTLKARGKYRKCIKSKEAKHQFCVELYPRTESITRAPFHHTEAKWVVFFYNNNSVSKSGLFIIANCLGVEWLSDAGVAQSSAPACC
jgi:hypothetical protein